VKIQVLWDWCRLDCKWLPKVLDECAASICRVLGLPCRWRQQNPPTISDNLPVYTASNPRRLESSTSLQEVESYITVVSWKGC